MDVLKIQIKSDLIDLMEDQKAGLFENNEPARWKAWARLIEKIRRLNKKEEQKDTDEFYQNGNVD